jgi:hypothetical protein
MDAETFAELKASTVAPDGVYVEIETERGSSETTNPILIQMAETIIKHVVAQSAADDWYRKGPQYNYTLEDLDQAFYNLTDPIEPVLRNMNLRVISVTVISAVRSDQSLFAFVFVWCTLEYDEDDEDDEDNLD